MIRNLNAKGGGRVREDNSIVLVYWKRRYLGQHARAIHFCSFGPEGLSKIAQRFIGGLAHYKFVKPRRGGRISHQRQPPVLPSLTGLTNPCSPIPPINRWAIFCRAPGCDRPGAKPESLLKALKDWSVEAWKFIGPGHESLFQP
jgi:hypothetical protein